MRWRRDTESVLLHHMPLMWPLPVAVPADLSADSHAQTTGASGAASCSCIGQSKPAVVGSGEAERAVAGATLHSVLCITVGAAGPREGQGLT